MKYLKFCFYLSIAILLLFNNCGKTANREIPETESLSDQQLVSIIGENNNHKGEFILVRPIDDTLIDNSLNILVPDDNSIKIYDINGNGKKILGRKGQGPGEFRKTPFIYLSPTGYLTALNRGYTERFCLYDSSYNLVKDSWLNEKPGFKQFFKENQYLMSYVMAVDNLYALSEHEFFWSVELNTPSELRMAVIYESRDKFRVIFHGKMPGDLKLESGNRALGGNMGRFIMGALPGRKMYYINTDEEIFTDDNNGEYILHIVSLDSFEDKEFRRHFEPAPYPPDLADRSYKRRDPRSQEVFKDIYLETKRIYEQRKYWPMDGAIADGKLIYFFLHSQYKDKNFNELMPYKIVDVFDSENEIFLKPIKIPRSSSVRPLKNGYTADVGEDKDGYPEIRIYKSSLFIHIQQDFAELPPLGHIELRLCRLFKREFFINDRF